jgi:aminoglycoside phosphotransferase family enzyme
MPSKHFDGRVQAPNKGPKLTMGSPVNHITGANATDAPSECIPNCPLDLTKASELGKPPCPIDDQKETLAFLGQPKTYGIDTSVDRLGLVDSILYFTEHHTYRIRRNRPMGCHDKIDVAERGLLAQAELSFGLSVSPEIYLCLRPVLKGPSGLKLGEALQHVDAVDVPEGWTLVDWLVQMLRYDYNHTFDKISGLEDLSRNDCSSLAQYLVNLHSWSSSYDQESWENWLEAHLAGFEKRPQLFAPQPGLRGLKASLDQAQQLSKQLKPLLRSRAQNGQVQALHGNLRLANFVSQDGAPQLINPRLVDGSPQRGDCLFDIAGLLIDLWSQGQRGPSNWIFSRYFGSLLDNSNLDGLQALSLMMFVRSIDRALAICPVDEACRSGARCSLASAFEDFVRTAMESLLEEPKVLVVLGGPDSNVKTEFAQSLAPALGRMPGGLWLSASHEKELLDPGGRQNARHPTGLCDLVHEYMLEKARYGLEADFSVLLEWDASHPACLKAMRQFASATDATLVPIWITANQQISADDTLAGAGWTIISQSMEIEDMLHRAHGLLGKASKRDLPSPLH